MSPHKTAFWQKIGRELARTANWSREHDGSFQALAKWPQTQRVLLAAFNTEHRRLRREAVKAGLLP